jgi:hypothetical protein
VSDPTSHLRTLAGRLADSYVAFAQPRAILLAGSAATGDADVYSDLDMLVYYDQVPLGEAVANTPHELGAERYRCTASSDGSGAPDERWYSERYYLNGIECQVAHESVGAFEREITRLVVDLELEEELLKIMGGLFEGLPLYGEELIEQWRRRAAYTETLQRALIEKRWKFFPWWYFQERLRTKEHDRLALRRIRSVGVRHRRRLGRSEPALLLHLRVQAREQVPLPLGDHSSEPRCSARCTLRGRRAYRDSRPGATGQRGWRARLGAVPRHQPRPGVGRAQDTAREPRACVEPGRTRRELLTVGSCLGVALPPEAARSDAHRRRSISCAESRRALISE